MTRVIFVGEDPKLADRLRQTCGSACIELETARWAEWPGTTIAIHGLEGALLDLTAPNAPGLDRIAQYHAQYGRLRLLLVLGSDLAASEPLQQVLKSRRVDFVRTPVDANEVWQRMLRLVSRTIGPREAPCVSSPSGRRLKVGRRNLVRPGIPAAFPILRPTSFRVGPQEPGVVASPVAAFPYLVPELHASDSGRLDAKKIGSFFGLRLAEIARMLGRDLSAVHKTPDAPSLQPGLALFERIAAPLLYLAGSAENLRIWMNAPNPDLEDETPLAVLKDGEGEIVAELLEDALVGQPG
jgi:hypothetical protein